MRKPWQAVLKSGCASQLAQGMEGCFKARKGQDSTGTVKSWRILQTFQAKALCIDWDVLIGGGCVFFFLI